MQEIATLISSAKICMVSNTMLNWPLSRQSLRNQWYDPSGVIWFLFMKTDIESSIFENGRMEVFYANAEKSLFMSLSGEATLVSHEDIPTDQTFPFLKTLGNEALGSAFGIVRFEPVDIYAWDDHLQDMVPLILKREKVTQPVSG